VTTIQKLNTAISKTRYLGKMAALKNERIVFIFDECHRSQFGKTHEEIKKFFENCQMFGFTGTPIFEPNAGKNEYGKRTTKMLFGDCLHKYVITDAIRDENVLKFSVEYIRTFRKKDHILDIDVEAIDEAEVMDAPERLNNIAEFIIANHNRKTHSREFTAIFCVSSVAVLIEYFQNALAEKRRGKTQSKIGDYFFLFGK
jgi:type I restriction enzyme, R subunit